MNSQVLHRLIEQARRVRDDAAGAAAAADQQLEQAQRTLDLLSGYLSDHLQRAPTDKGIVPALLPVRESFTRKLDLAIAEQSRQRDGLREVARARRMELVERQRRLLAYETLLERRTAARLRTQQRSEQRQTDELAARTARLARAFS
jgi:flagellar FliJ protein